MKSLRTCAVTAIVWICVFCGQSTADLIFGRPENLGATINSAGTEAGSMVSSDGLTLYFFNSNWDIEVSHRNTREEAWGPAALLPEPINSPAHEALSSISKDGLSLYFSDGVFHNVSPRPGGLGGGDLWVATRSTKNSPWFPPENLGPIVNSSAFEGGPSLSGDGLSLFFSSNRFGGSGSFDLWGTTRPNPDAAWGTPVNLGPQVNSPSGDVQPSISADGLILFFQSERAGRPDLWYATRRSVTDEFGPASPFDIDPLGHASQADIMPDITYDGSNIMFTSFNRTGGLGGWDLWQIPVIPIVDFDGNERVDIKDLLRLIESWGQEDSSVDIAPAPFGDGVVDAADLEILMSYWGREVYDPTLLALWKLDESEGDVAYDSAAENDGTVLGNPLWQPEDGHTYGALQFDGIDDLIIVKPVLNPEDGPFSVFAWIKGAAPGQVILSQEDGVNWLMADTEQGAFRTDISDPTKGARRGTAGGLPLISPAIITDGKWHHVGFVWDGSKRILYVDDLAVAEDSLSNLAGASAGLRIGANSNLEAGSFWSGLIDDVRIYNRVVKP